MASSPTTVSLPFTPPDYITSLQLGNGDIPPPTPPRNSVRASNIQINENYEPEAINECDNNNDVQSIDSTGKEMLSVNQYRNLMCINTDHIKD